MTMLLRFTRAGALESDEIRNMFQAHHVPLPDDLLRAVMSL